MQPCGRHHPQVKNHFAKVLDKGLIQFLGIFLHWIKVVASQMTWAILLEVS